MHKVYPSKGESPQCIFVAPVFHQVGVDFLEMQESQKSDIWSWNFYFNLKNMIRTFQAVYWKILLLLPYGKAGSEFHLMKWALSLCQRDPSWVMAGIAWKPCSADFCKLEPKSTVTQEPLPPFRMAVVCAYVFAPDGRGWQINIWSKQDECVPGVEENCTQIKSRYVHSRWQYSLEPYSTLNCFSSLADLCKFA